MKKVIITKVEWELDGEDVDFKFYHNAPPDVAECLEDDGDIIRFSTEVGNPDDGFLPEFDADLIKWEKRQGVQIEFDPSIKIDRVLNNFEEVLAEELEGDEAYQDWVNDFYNNTRL